MQLKKALAAFLCTALLATAFPTVGLTDGSVVLDVSQSDQPAETTAPVEEPAPLPTDVPDVTTDQSTTEPTMQPTEVPTQAPEGTPEGTPEATLEPAPTEAPSLSVEVRDAAASEGMARLEAEVRTNYAGELRYQWQRLDVPAYEAAPPASDEEDFWLDIEGQTGPALSIDELALDDLARYRYRVEVSAGELVVCSNAAQVTDPEVEPSPTPAGELLTGAALTGKCGDRVTFSLSADGAMVISGTGAMYHYADGSRTPWAGARPSIKSLVIQTGVTVVGNYAFTGCVNLTSVTLPTEGLTTLGVASFYNCDGLSSFTIPNCVTMLYSLVFDSCDGLTSITVPDTVTIIGSYAFAHCVNLTSVTLSSNLTKLYEGMLYDCQKLNNIVLPNGIETIGTKVFASCTKLTNLTIPASVKSIGELAFAGCTAFSSFTVPSTVESIGKLAFSKCSGLTAITIPSNVTSIGESAFSECTGLISASILPGPEALSNQMFYGCTSLKNVSLPEGLKRTGSYTFQDCKGLTSIALPAGLMEIGSMSFMGCTSLVDVQIPSSVTTVNNYAFDKCESLRSIVLPDGLTVLGSCAFLGCKSLEHINIPAGVTKIENNTFNSCTKLSSIELPPNTTSIGEGAFLGSGLTSIDIPGDVHDIPDYTFQNCANLASIRLWRDSASIGASAFSGCGKLKTIYFRGTSDDWKYVLLDMGPNNKPIKSAKVYCYIDIAKLQIPGQAYDGTTRTPKPVVVFFGQTLREGTDYKITGYRNNINVGTATIEVQGLGQYAGVCTGTFLIAPRDIALCAVGATGDMSADGEVLSTTVIVLDGTKQLTSGVDYTCQASADETQITVTGMGNYEGEYTQAVAFRWLIARGVCGTGLTWTLGASGALHIDGEGAMDDYAPGAAPWYAHRALITSVAIGSGVTLVDGGAFDGCDAIEGFSVTSGNAAYRGADGVLYSLSGALVRYPAAGERTSYAVPTGTGRILAGAFRGCAHLTSISLPASLTAIDGDALGDCGRLTYISVAAGNANFRSANDLLTNVTRALVIRCPAGAVECRIPSGATGIAAGAFRNCDHLATLKLSVGIANVGENAFSGCASLTSVEFAGTPAEWNTVAAAVGTGNEALLSADRRYDLSAFTLTTELSQYDRTGSAIEPRVTLSRSGVTLTQGTDFTVEYLNNVGIGTAVARATGTGAQYVGSCQATFAITSSQVDSVDLVVDSITIGAGQSVSTLGALVMVQPDTAANRTLSWSVNDASVARVDAATGTITGVKVGRCTVTATATDGSSVTDTVTVEVVAKGKGVTAIRLSTSALTIYPGDYPLPTATLTPASPRTSAIAWVSSNPAVAEAVDGVLRGHACGTATLTAIASSGYTASCTVTVAPRYASLTLDRAVLSLGAGEAYALSWQLTLPDGAEADPTADLVSFSSSNGKAATINPATGEIKAVKAGTATITARTSSGLSAACVVTVLGAPAKVSISAPRASIGAGDSMTLSALFPSGTGGSVTWSLPAPQAVSARIDAVSGVLTAGPTAGSVTILATTYNGKSATIVVNIVAAPTYIVMSRPTLTLCAGDRYTLSYSLPYGSAGAVCYSSDNADVATVDAGGVITAGSTLGTARIKAETYNGEYAYCAVTVVEAPLTLSLQIEQTEFGVGEYRQMSCTIAPTNVPCTLKYTSSSAGIATVSATGLVKGVKAGRTTIRVEAYNGVYQTMNVTIRTAPTSVSISLNAVLGLGETVKPLTPTNAGSTGAITLTSDNAEVLRVNPDNTVTAVALGSATLTATTYNGKKASKTVKVYPAPTNTTLNLVVDDGFGGILLDYRDDDSVFTVARGDYTIALASYYDFNSDDDDYVPPGDLAAGTITMTVTDPSVVSFGAKGRISFVKNGTTDIVYTAYNGVFRRLRLNVIDPPTSIELDADAPALLCYAKFEINDKNRDQNIQELYDILHYTVSSSSTSVISPYKRDDPSYGASSYGLLLARKKGSATITVKLFNGVTAKKSVSVRRNRYVETDLPDMDDLDEYELYLCCESAEILSLNKVEVTYLLINYGPLRISKLVDVEAGFVADDSDLCYKELSSLSVGLSPYSVKRIKMTFSGNAVDADEVFDQDLTQYVDGGDYDGTYGYLDSYDPYDDYEEDYDDDD